MARVLTAKEICERALRAIGEFSLSESAPDGEQMREALFWLDLIMAELSGTTRLFHLIPESIPLTLEAGTTKYVLKSSLGSDFPADGIQFPVGAYLLLPSGERKPVTILTRDHWKELPRETEPGIPDAVYIDRYPEPTLWTHPTLQAEAAGTYTLLLDVQKYTPNVAPSGVSGLTPSGAALTGFRQAWQLFLVERLSQKLGSGPIMKLQEGTILRFERQADKAERALKAFENREHDTEDPVVKPYGMD